MARQAPLSWAGLEINVSGHLLRIARLQDEYYVPAPEPEVWTRAIAALDTRVDLYTFVQALDDRLPRYSFHQELDRVAVLPLTTYQHWIDKQIKFKCRNRLKKAIKSGVETHVVELSPTLLHGIKDIYDETPIRQGRKNCHYHKSLPTLWKEHSTFMERSDFIAAYKDSELIGFAKVTHGPNYSIIMNMIAKVGYRALSPTNALVAKTIEVTTERGIRLLKYGVWGRKGLNDFKVSNAFECMEVPRYFIPLTPLGHLGLMSGLHRGLKELLPEPLVARATQLRERWFQLRYGGILRTVGTISEIPAEATFSSRNP